jgi:hypothetical protein
VRQEEEAAARYVCDFEHMRTCAAICSCCRARGAACQLIQSSIAGRDCLGDGLLRSVFR